MTPTAYALTIRRTPRCVQQWCSAGLIGKRIGGRWEIAEGTEPPVLGLTKRKVGRVKRVSRLENFKRKALEV